MSCGISSPKQLFRVVTNAEGTLAPYRAPDPRGRAPFRNIFIPPSHQTGVGWASPRAERLRRRPTPAAPLKGRDEFISCHLALNPVQPEPFGWLASQPLRINFGALRQSRRPRPNLSPSENAPDQSRRASSSFPDHRAGRTAPAGRSPGRRRGGGTGAPCGTAPFTGGAAGAEASCPDHRDHRVRSHPEEAEGAPGHPVRRVHRTTGGGGGGGPSPRGPPGPPGPRGPPGGAAAGRRARPIRSDRPDTARA